MTKLDQRLHAYRADLADEKLRGQVDAPHFAAGILHQVVAPLANVYRSPQVHSMQITQALMGETIRVFEQTDAWIWGQLTDDGYVGYLRAADVGTHVQKPTHRVAVASAILFPLSDLKSQPVKQMAFHNRFTAVGVSGEFLELAAGGFVFAEHCAPVSQSESDPVAVAEVFLGAPYLWGGKSIAGLDCSGLVQLALTSCGHSCLRDADLQERTFGTAISLTDLAGLRRGDLVFWDGHVGMMCDSTSLLHANGYHMAVVKEPLRDAIARINQTGKPVSSIKRLQ